MNPLWTAAILLVIWVSAAGAFRALITPRLRELCGGDASTGFARLVVRLYVRLMHRPSYTGRGLRPREIDPGPLIVVSNHTAGVDPLLIQADCRFHIRWMMARDMMDSRLRWLWRWQEMIPVSFDERSGRERTGRRAGAQALMEGIRHVRAGGVLGIFPEGGIARPRREIRPFLPGLGLLASRTGAPVLLIWISGTPENCPAFASLFRTSRSRVAYVAHMRLEGKRPREIVRLIRERLRAASGWRLNETPLDRHQSG